MKQTLASLKCPPQCNALSDSSQRLHPLPYDFQHLLQATGPVREALLHSHC